MTTDPTPVEIGAAAPDFNLASNRGSRVRLSDYRELSPVVLYFMREFN